MRRFGVTAATLAVALLVVGGSSCGGGTHPDVSVSTTSTTRPTNQSSTSPTTTTTTTEVVTAHATVSPDQGATGTTLTFTVVIRGPGTLGSEGVMFGDGDVSGANAGDVACGATDRADHTNTYRHAYLRPGTYVFRDQVTVQAPPPSCAFEHTEASVAVIVAAPLSDATLNGAFVSPTKNIACSIGQTPPASLRCATFSPPRLVTMDPSGSIQTCSGNQCDLGNPAMDTPVLPYGSATAGGPFQCLSRQQGVTCTVVGHKGFELSRSGVQQIG